MYEVSRRECIWQSSYIKLLLIDLSFLVLNSRLSNDQILLIQQLQSLVVQVQRLHRFYMYTQTKSTVNIVYKLVYCASSQQTQPATYT